MIGDLARLLALPTTPSALNGRRPNDMAALNGGNTTAVSRVNERLDTYIHQVLRNVNLNIYPPQHKASTTLKHRRRGQIARIGELFPLFLALQNTLCAYRISYQAGYIKIYRYPVCTYVYRFC